MIKLFLLLFSINAMALTPKQEMRARLETIEDKYTALEKCGVLFNTKERSYDKMLDVVSEDLDTEKEACLLNQKKKSNKEKNFKKAKKTIEDEDCSLLGTEFLKAVCIVMKRDDGI